MANLLGEFKEGTGIFLVEGDDVALKFDISVSKKVLNGESGQELLQIANGVRNSAQAFTIDVAQFQRGYRELTREGGSIRSVFSLSEIFKRAYNRRDELQLTKFAKVLEILTTNRQLVQILVNIMNKAEEYDIDFGVTYR